MGFLDLIFPGSKDISKLKTEKKKPEEEKSKGISSASVGCYKADINCENCHILLEFELPKGQTVVNYCEKLICPNCGCPVFEYCSIDSEDKD
jgi:hypothetical protein